MGFLLYLLSLPFSSTGAELDSPSWRVREKAEARLTRELPRSIPELFLCGDSPNIAATRDRILDSHYFTREFRRAASVVDLADRLSQHRSPIYLITHSQYGSAFSVLQITEHGAGKNMVWVPVQPIRWHAAFIP